MALAIVLGLAGGVVIALAAAIGRTEGAYGRYLRATHAADAYVVTGIALGSPNLPVGRFGRLPSVVRAERTLILAVIARNRSGEPILVAGPRHIEFQAPSDDRTVNGIDTPLIVEGRLPDPRRADEALVDRPALRILGLRVGDRLTVRLISDRTITHHLDKVRLGIDPRSPVAASWGPLATVRIVGVQAHAKLDADGGFVNFTPAFRRAHGGPRIGAWTDELAVRLRHHGDDMVGFGQAVRRAAGTDALGIYDPVATAPEIRRSIDLMGTALRLLAVVATAALALLGGQALLRQATVDERATPALVALGMTRRQLLGVAALRSVLIAAAAAATAVATAAALSPLSPLGWARELDPQRGVRFDAAPIVLGAALLLVAITGLGTLAALHETARRRRAERRRTAPGAPLPHHIWRLAPSPPAAAGMRMALFRGSPSGVTPVRATLGGAVVAVAIAIAALTFSASLGHLLGTPRLYGQTWDFETLGGGPAQPETERPVLRDPGVRAVARSYAGPVTVGRHDVGVRATMNLKGRVEPAVLEGRAPRAPDEALVGTKTLRALHLHIGDRLTVRAGHRAVRLRIVGRGVLPADKWTALGEGVSMDLKTLLRIAPGASTSALLIRLRSGPGRAATLTRLNRRFETTVAMRPQQLGDFGRVHAMPGVTAATFVLAAAAALAHLLVTSVRRRGRDLAVLKALGFTRAQVLATVAWQATTVAIIGILIGVPLGIAVGRFGWNVFADGLGIAPQAVTPVPAVLLVVPAAIVLANIVAALPARAASRIRPTLVLRAE